MKSFLFGFGARLREASGPCGLEAQVAGSGPEQGPPGMAGRANRSCAGTAKRPGRQHTQSGPRKSFPKRWKAGERKKGSASLPAYLRRKTPAVTHVGSFYSFLPAMCRADPEQAGVLFSCNEAEWTRGSSPAVARPGLRRWGEAGVLGAALRPPACRLSPRPGLLWTLEVAWSPSFSRRSSMAAAEEGGGRRAGKAATLGKKARIYTVKGCCLGTAGGP